MQLYAHKHNHIQTHIHTQTYTLKHTHKQTHILRHTPNHTNRLIHRTYTHRQISMLLDTKTIGFANDVAVVIVTIYLKNGRCNDPTVALD